MPLRGDPRNHAAGYAHALIPPRRSAGRPWASCNLPAHRETSGLGAPRHARSPEAIAATAIQMCPTSTSSATFGDIIELTVRVENVGTETIPGLSVRLGLPDGLDARA